MDYIREVEKILIEKRNKGLMLFHRDWLIIEKWKALGIPVKIIKEGIDSAITGLNFSQKGEFYTVPTLAYCEKQVLKTWKDFKESRVGRQRVCEESKEKAPFCQIALEYLNCLHRKIEVDVEIRQEKEQSVIPEDLKHRLFSDLETLGEKIKNNELKEEEKLEEELKSLDVEILNSLKQAIDEKRLSSLKEECRKKLLPYRNRMEKKDYFDSLEAMLDQKVRQEFGFRDLTEEEFYR